MAGQPERGAVADQAAAVQEGPAQGGRVARVDEEEAGRGGLDGPAELGEPDGQTVPFGDEQRDRLRSGEIPSFTAEKRYLRKDGSPVWVRITVAQRCDADGRPLYDISIVEDISDRKRTEIALKESESRFRSLCESSLTGIYIIPVSYTHLRAHETVLDLVCRLLLEKKKNTTIIVHKHVSNTSSYHINVPKERQTRD